MEISILLIRQIAELFLMILMGYLVVRTGILKEEDSKILSTLVLYLAIPCVIINAFQVEYTQKKLKAIILALAASILLQVLLLLVTWVLGRIFHLDVVEYCSVYYSNSGNLVVPVVSYILGDEWVLYGCIYMCIQTIFIWTHGKKKLDTNSAFDWKKLLLNINMISIFIGVFLFIARLQLPTIINETLNTVGSLFGPLSMIVTGMLVAGMQIRTILQNKRIYLITFLRLLLMPVIALLILKISGMAGWHEDAEKILMVIYLATITPAASTVTQMSQVYGNDSQYASAINIMTTIVAIVTMPLMILLFQHVI